MGQQQKLDPPVVTIDREQDLPRLKLQGLLAGLHALQAPEEGVLWVLCNLELSGLGRNVVGVAVQEVQPRYLHVLLHLQMKGLFRLSCALGRYAL